MNNHIKYFFSGILTLPRSSKRVIAITTDIFLCFFCTWLAFTIRLEELILLKEFNFYPALISIIVALPTFWLFGLYRTIFRFTGLSIILTVLTSTLVYGLIFFFIVGIYTLQGVPRSVGVIQPMLLFFSVISSRLAIKFILVPYTSSKKLYNKKNVMVYGAGEAGRQLIVALENSPEFKVIGFLDDNEQLHRQVLLGKTVYSPLKLEKIIRSKSISLVFLALPTISRSKRNKIITNLNKYQLVVKTLPSISEIVDGRITISDIKDLNIDDLLNRDEIKPNMKLISKNINSKIVLVTGAGGSIGSELCRQIVRLKPSKLLLIELSEFALYKIQDELKNLSHNVKIISLLVNTQDQTKLETIFEAFKVDTIYHAAAYKHVPLVEENICEGVKNNVFSTLAIANASILKKVSNLVLISSDKAVRPTNIMGASKRLSEMCMQGIYKNTKDISTHFSIVRFGNVLESSGSVIPKFKKQIKEGGPVTLTHKDVTRYFMTVTEAAQLVIQAGAMGEKSEVFVLDMGESVKIIDLIHQMIALSGLTVKDKNNITGDIEIKITGLRPGEKLYEELLIGDNPQTTNHPKIQKIHDPYIPFNQLEADLNNLKRLLSKNESKQVKNLLQKLLQSLNLHSEIVDHIYVEETSTKNKPQHNLSVIHSKDSQATN
tara:strand:+ start:26403 stop:28382 length:1980 start_codon:yes stop_codon:yes gene_type:complete